MKDHELTDKLTPAAGEALDELVEDFRTQTLINAAKSAARDTGEVKEISVRDILTSVNLSQLRLRKTWPTLMERLLTAYSVLGTILTIGGLAYFAYKNVAFKQDETNRWVLSVIVVGATLAVFPILMRRLKFFPFSFATGERADGPSKTTELLTDYLLIWPKIELTARDIIASQLGESSAKKPLSMLINELQQSGILSLEDEEKLKELLNTRNKIVHGVPELGLDQLQNSISEAQKLLSKMKRRSFNSHEAQL